MGRAAGPGGDEHRELICQFSVAGTNQGDALSRAVRVAILGRVLGLEFSVKRVGTALDAVAQAALVGASRNCHGVVTIGTLLQKAIEGMDAAVAQIVEANCRALRQLIAHGVDLHASQFRHAVEVVEKLDAVLIDAIDRAVDAAEESIKAPWSQAFHAWMLNGSASGATAAAGLYQLAEQARSRPERFHATNRAGQTMLDYYTHLVSGVLIGLSDPPLPRSSAA